MRPASQRPAEASPRRRPARVGEMACLPLFFPMKGRRAVVAGGTDAAAWKAELLAAVGADVHVYAERPGVCLEELLEKGCPAGTANHHPHPWSPACLSGAALAIADAASTGEARAFWCAARAASVPVNVIDKPKYCEFQFGSIVNRSPVVIGISTNGAAPILGQAIRRRIETLLPPSFKEWAALAGAVRSRVLERLSSGPERRSFWERFTDLAFSSTSPPETMDKGDLEVLLAGAEDAASGKVTFVGAGLGDAEDLTLRAVRALQSADIILFDDTIDDSVLELARREARRVLVSTKGNQEYNAQKDICGLMVSLANQGSHVVRLHADDPMTIAFARKMMERQARENIPVAIIPALPAVSSIGLRGDFSTGECAAANRSLSATTKTHRANLSEAVDWNETASRANPPML